MKYCGMSYSKKIEDVRNEMKKKLADYLLLTSLHCICWLYNIRGNDIEYNPLVY